MYLSKLTLIASVATLLGAASPVLADETPPMYSPEDDMSVVNRTDDDFALLRYREGYGYVPSARDIIPPRTVPLGETPPTEFESTGD